MSSDDDVRCVSLMMLEFDDGDDDPANNCHGIALVAAGRLDLARREELSTETPQHINIFVFCETHFE